MKSFPLLVLAVGLAACSAPSQPTGVASLVTSSVAVPPSTSASVEPPRQRLDMTDADREVLYAPYLKCLDAHGIAPRGTEGKKVDQATQDLIASAKEDISSSGSPFKGPVYAQDGTTVLIAEGEVPDYATIEDTIVVFVKGVVGEMPSS